MKTVAVVQCTADDFLGSLSPEDYVVGTAQTAQYFDDIIVACPETPGTEKIKAIAKKWGVRFYAGDEMNVAKRLLGAAHITGAEIIVRLLLRQFYLDIEQVGRMVQKLKDTSADYVVLPPDYNYALAADVGKTKALEKVVSHAANVRDAREQASIQFSPWVYVEENPDKFQLTAIDGGPVYPAKKVRAIRQKYDQLISENQTHFAWNYPASGYAFMAQYLSPDDTVLDIACGKGQGVRRLKENCARAVGVDLTPEHIEIAIQDSGHIEGISYEVGDAETYQSPAMYDAVVSLHTLEHLSDPDAFFANAIVNLKPRGKLLIEVPLLLPHPLKVPLMPWHEKEYELQELVNEVLKHGFSIDEVWAKKRHIFRQIEFKNKLVETNVDRMTAGIVIAHKN